MVQRYNGKNANGFATTFPEHLSHADQEFYDFIFVGPATFQCDYFLKFADPAVVDGCLQ
jgi:hypothetical protein